MPYPPPRMPESLNNRVPLKSSALFYTSGQQLMMPMGISKRHPIPSVSDVGPSMPRQSSRNQVNPCKRRSYGWLQRECEILEERRE